MNMINTANNKHIVETIAGAVGFINSYKNEPVNVAVKRPTFPKVVILESFL